MELKIKSAQGRYGYADCPQGIPSNIGEGRFNAGQPLIAVLFTSAEAAQKAVGTVVQTVFGGTDSKGLEIRQVKGAVKSRNLEREEALSDRAFEKAAIWAKAAQKVGIALTRDEILDEAKAAKVAIAENAKAAREGRKITMTQTGGSIFNLNNAAQPKEEVKKDAAAPGAQG